MYTADESMKEKTYYYYYIFLLKHIFTKRSYVMRDKIRIHFIKRFIKKHHKYQPNTTDTIETPIASTAGILDGGTETPAET